MTTWAIGDVQGCVRTLTRLWKRIDFVEGRDRAWFVGDLVNRGPDSLEVLRFVHGLGSHAVTVLGNHDLHLLAVAEGVVEARRKDTLEPILAAPDRDELLDWLRFRPLLYREGRWTLVHAGIPPQWTAEEAADHAAEVEAALRGPDPAGFLTDIRKPTPEGWDASSSARKRRRYITAALTRMRMCHADGRLEFDYKGPPDQAPKGLRPWFEVSGRRAAADLIVFGHWAALGLHLTRNLLGLDSACVWGRQLTAVALEDRRVVSEPLADDVGLAPG